jgi:DNA-binding transcriptional LysR family regulator
LEIDRLRHFCAVAETGSVRRAAELLAISPSALSKAITLLEAELEVELFTRVGRGLCLSNEGKKLHALGRKLLDEHARLLEAMRGDAPEVPPVRVGSFEVFTTYLFAEVARRYFADLPVFLFELGPGRIEDAVVRSEVDVGLTYAPVPNPDVDFLPVTTFEMGLFARRSAFDAVEHAAVPFVVPVTPVAGSIAASRSLDGWPEGTVPRLVRYRCELLESCLAFARNGLAVVHAPRFVVTLANHGVKEDRRLVPRALPRPMKPVRLTIYVVKRRGLAETRAVRRLASAVRAIVRDADA